MMIPLSKQFLEADDIELVSNVLKSGWWTMGPLTAKLEERFAQYLKIDFCVAVNSCTSALHLALMLMAGGEGLHVITTPMTFAATINSIMYNYLTPVLVDIDKQTGNIDPELIIERIVASDYDRTMTKGILPVHYAGYPCNMERLKLITDDFDLFMVQDCAHAVESEWRGEKVATYGDMGCFSFNPIKNIASTEMGMISCANDFEADTFRQLRAHGMNADALDRVTKPGEYLIFNLGYKYNPTDVDSALALCQLKRIDFQWETRRNIAHHYEEFFDWAKKEGCFNGQTPLSYKDPFEVKRGWHLYVVNIGNRDQFVMEMREREVFCGIHYRPIHSHPFYQDRFQWKVGMFPNAEWWGDTCVSLPLGPGMSDGEVNQVVDAMADVLKSGEYLLKGDLEI